MDAKVDHYAVIARQKGDDWFLGAISNHDPHLLNCSLDFLGEGNYEAEIYSDGPETEKDPNILMHKKMKVNKNSSLELRLSGDGGAAIHFSKLAGPGF